MSKKSVLSKTSWTVDIICTIRYINSCKNTLLQQCDQGFQQYIFFQGGGGRRQKNKKKFWRPFPLFLELVKASLIEEKSTSTVTACIE